MQYLIESDAVCYITSGPVHHFLPVYCTWPGKKATYLARTRVLQIEYIGAQDTRCHIYIEASKVFIHPMRGGIVKPWIIQIYWRGACIHIPTIYSLLTRLAERWEWLIQSCNRGL